MGVESNAKQNLENFSKNIMECGLGIQVDTAFLSFQAALEYVFQMAEKERLILAIDEYPYVARTLESFASTLQPLIDKYKDTSQLMLILFGEDTSVCATYLKNLIALGLVQKETPYGEKTSRKSVYAIADNMFRFWYRFVPANHSTIARGAADLVYKRIEPCLPDYMGKVFEEICKQYLWKLLLKGESPVEFTELGRWWGTDPAEKKQTEVDIMGEQDKDTALFGECKWTNEKVDAGVLETLAKRSQLFHYKNTQLYLFSKSGFTKGCMDVAGRLGNVTLVTYKDML